MRKNVLVKISGDCLDNKGLVHQFLASLAHNNHLVIVVGGGTQITKALKKAKIKDPENFTYAGRELRSLEERQIARDVLETNQAGLQDFLDANHVHCAVEVPVLYSGTVMCHVNGDIYVKAMYNGFDEIYVVTTGKRYAEKEHYYREYPKITVVTEEGPWPF